MKISRLCLLVSAIFLSIAFYATFAPERPWSQNTISMLLLLAVAVSCLGALELKIQRRVHLEQRRKASTLASALRNGALT